MLVPTDWRFSVPVSEQAKPEEGQRNLLREEDARDPGLDVGEAVADAPDDEVGKGAGLPDEGRPVLRRAQEPVGHEGGRQFEDCIVVW